MTERQETANPWERREQENELIQLRMGKIKHKIAIISGKGGVGKSLVTVNLAALLAKDGREGMVAIFDADLTGPCVPKMMGLKGEKLMAGPPGIFPAVGAEGVKVISMALFLPSDDSQ